MEVDSEETHIVGNDTEGLAITFHVYQPELQMDMFSDNDADIAAIDVCEIDGSQGIIRYQEPNFCAAE